MILDTAPQCKGPISELRQNLLEPFITATNTALGEMAGVEVFVHHIHPGQLQPTLGDISAVVELTSATERLLILIFPNHTAAALTRRILAEASVNVDDALIRDCVAEVANVVAGQAKALLAETPYR